jgi:hypothetical protein
MHGCDVIDRRWFAGLWAAMVVAPLTIPPLVVAGSPSDGVNGKAAQAGAAADVGAVGGKDVAVASFEQELSKASPGTYVVYKRLLARSQEEVFAAYKNGVPMEDIRAMVTDRFARSR